MMIMIFWYILVVTIFLYVNGFMVPTKCTIDSFILTNPSRHFDSESHRIGRTPPFFLSSNGRYRSQYLSPPKKTSLWMTRNNDDIVDDSMLSSSISSIMTSTSHQHQTTRQHDSQWYQEYVLDLLGEDFCIKQWPDNGFRDDSKIINTDTQLPTLNTDIKSSKRPISDSILEKQPLKISQKPQETVTSIPNTAQWKVEEQSKKESENKTESVLPVSDIINLEELKSAIYMPEEQQSPQRQEHNELAVENYNETLLEEIIDIEVDEDVDTLEQISNGEIVLGDSDDSTTVLTLESPQKVQTVVDTKVWGQSSSEESPDRFPKAKVLDKTDASNSPTISTANLTTNMISDQRVVVYRNIVGNTLTYVPLQNLTKLGYTVSELERIQTDSLCVVVNDQIRNPRMGVPLQWCIQDKTAPPQTQIVGSIEEALRIIADDNATKLQEKRNRRRKENEERIQDNPKIPRPTITDKQTTRDVPDNSSYDVEMDEIEYKRRKQPSSSRLKNGQKRKRTEDISGVDMYNSEGSLRRNRARREMDSAEDMKPARRTSEQSRRQDRQERRLNRNRVDAPKRIYNARDPYNGVRKTSVRNAGDPPDPKSRIWVDFETFKKLLRQEAKFRMRFVGEDWAPIIKHESDWRLQLYENWLWALHDGVGSSIVPPSRYERARKMRQRSLRSLNGDNIPRSIARSSQRQSRRREKVREPRPRN